MESISLFTGSNIAGFETLEFAPLINIASIAAAVNDEITTAISLTGISALLSIDALQGTIEFDESPKDDSAGEYFIYSIKAFVPKNSLALIANLNEIRRHLHVVKVKDNNGNFRLVGSLERPLQFRFSPSPGKRPGEASGIQIEFYGKSTDPAPFYNV